MLMAYITAVLYTYTMIRNFRGLDSVCKTMQDTCSDSEVRDQHS